MNLNDHTWNCPRPGCKKWVMAYTEAGLRALADEHISQHMREDRETQQTHRRAMEFIEPRRDYNILKMSPEDMCFLKTRGIAVDGMIEIDYGYEAKPSGNSELGQKLWGKILNAVWPRENNGTN